LFLIFAVRFRDQRLEIACAALALMGVVLALWILGSHEAGTAAAPIVAVHVEDVGDQATTYLVTYLLPFVAIAQPGLREVVGYALFFLVGALIFVRSDMVQVNPTLYVLGWRIVKVTSKENRMIYAISHRRELPGKVTGVELTPGILLVTGEDSK
jgi:hypothetical protein